MSAYYDDVVQRGSVSIAYRDYGGQGSPVVLLHGATRNLGDWAQLAPLLAVRHRVVALDFRSHGVSTPCGPAWTFRDAVDDVAAVIRALHLDTPWLVGHSLGGMVATLCAAEGLACRGVVNIDGVGVSMPTVFSVPDPVAARADIQAAIAQMVEAMPPPSAAPSVLLTHEEVAHRLATHQGKDWAVQQPMVERSFFRWEDGRYEENPSAVAQAAVFHAFLDIDIFALTRAVADPLLFIGAIEPSAPSSGDGSPDVLQVWGDGVQLTFEQIMQAHPQIQWVGIPGDHMLVLHEVAALTPVLLRFLHMDTAVAGA